MSELAVRDEVLHPTRRLRRSEVLRRTSVPWILMTPALVLIVGIIVYPAINAVYLSFTSMSLLNINNPTYAGFGNFLALLDDPVFWKSIRISTIWTFGCVAVQLLLGMCGALILNSRFKGRAIIRGIVLLPWATPSVLVALMWMWILDPNLGIVNGVLRAVGVTASPIGFLSNQDLALPSLMFIDVWHGVPFIAVMILAALQGVPGELLESARMDGANAWKTFWRVVLPLITPSVLITVILRLVWTANYFDLILVLTNGGPANATLTVPLNAYITAYRAGDLGGGAALGVVQALLLAVLIAFYMRQIRKSELA